MNYCMFRDLMGKRLLMGRYSKVIIFGMIVIVSSLGGCRRGYFEGQRFYFPQGSLPEDDWAVVVIVSFESPPGFRVSDTSDKTYSIQIKNKKGDTLYFDSGKMRVGDVDSSVQWQTANSLQLVSKSEDGKVLLDKNLQFASFKNIYTVKK